MPAVFNVVPSHNASVRRRRQFIQKHWYDLYSLANQAFYSMEPHWSCTIKQDLLFPAGSYCSSAGMIFEISCDTVYGTSYSSAEVALLLALASTYVQPRGRRRCPEPVTSTRHTILPARLIISAATRRSRSPTRLIATPTRSTACWRRHVVGQLRFPGELAI